jgi:hypothetical protein
MSLGYYISPHLVRLQVISHDFVLDDMSNPNDKDAIEERAAILATKRSDCATTSATEWRYESDSDHLDVGDAQRNPSCRRSAKTQCMSLVGVSRREWLAVGSTWKLTHTAPAIVPRTWKWSAILVSFRQSARCQALHECADESEIGDLSSPLE